MVLRWVVSFLFLLRISGLGDKIVDYLVHSANEKCISKLLFSLVSFFSRNFPVIWCYFYNIYYIMYYKIFIIKLKLIFLFRCYPSSVIYFRKPSSFTNFSYCNSYRKYFLCKITFHILWLCDHLYFLYFIYIYYFTSLTYEFHVEKCERIFLSHVDFLWVKFFGGSSLSIDTILLQKIIMLVDILKCIYYFLFIFSYFTCDILHFIIFLFIFIHIFFFIM